jgi:hypothetical protein
MIDRRAFLRALGFTAAAVAIAPLLKAESSVAGPTGGTLFVRRGPQWSSTVTTQGPGNWSSASTWAGGVVPRDGQHVMIQHNVTLDRNVIFGRLG